MTNTENNIQSINEIKNILNTYSYKMQYLENKITLLENKIVLLSQPSEDNDFYKKLNNTILELTGNFI
jgi:hypothetical protein